MDKDHILAARFVASDATEDESRLDRVFINNLVLPCRIGVYDHEREGPQRVGFNVDLRVRRPERAIDDDIANVLSYDDVIDGIRRLTGERHINLVETLAEEIAGLCLADPRVALVRVRVEKLDVHPEAAGVGVEIERRRPARAPVNVYQLAPRPARR
jgi:dihydroneopterin aldolase